MTDPVIAQKVLVPVDVEKDKSNLFYCSCGKIATYLFGDS